MRWSLTITVAALISLAFTAKADRLDFFTDFFRGNDVYEMCQKSSPHALAYTAGLADSASRTMWALEMMRPPSGFEPGRRSEWNALINQGERVATYCRPPDINSSELKMCFASICRTRHLRNGKTDPQSYSMMR
jgi:hypothetical protein